MSKCFRGVIYSSASSIKKRLIITKIRYRYQNFHLMSHPFRCIKYVLEHYCIMNILNLIWTLYQVLHCTVLCTISSKGNWMILHVSPLIAGWRLESDSKKILLYFFLFLFCSIILKSRHCHQNETSSTALTLKAKYFITVNSFTFMQHTFHISLSTNVHPAI